MDMEPATEEDSNYTVIEYLKEHKGHGCGYCKGDDTSKTHGMWAHRMTVGHYQALIDRGWRRSGKYCYKPTMKTTCCPQYTIRCDAESFKLSKSQKKVLKRMHRYLSFGKEDSGIDIIKEEPNGSTLDQSKSACKKGKFVRQQRREAKGSWACKAKVQNQPKSLEDFLDEDLPQNAAHKLEVVLVSASSSCEDFNKSFLDSYSVYKKYQTEVHQDPIEKVQQHNYRRFLCEASLQKWRATTGPPSGFGAFHQQYWLDGRLIAVGVIDILPTCISSVYLFYDPKFSFLSLGTYASLREIALTRQLRQYRQDLRWYYMGFYIHSCPKMRYKSNYSPSYLLCPETFNWVPIEKCLPKLDVSEYSRLSDEDPSKDKQKSRDTHRVLCLYEGRPMLYGNLVSMKQLHNQNEEILEYLSLVGREAATSMLLCRV